MEIGSLHFRFGLRTLKTGLAVLLVTAGFALVNRGNPMIASLAAVFALRSDFETTLHFGKSRVLANFLGGAFAVGYIWIRNYTHNAELVQVIGVPLLLMALIILNDGINNNSGIIGSTAAFLMISLTVPAGESYFYAVERVFDTFLWVAAAVLMNIGTSPISPSEVAKEIEQHETKQQP